jgi:hypothetical protein
MDADSDNFGVIYPAEANEHIKQRHVGERILGNKGQFCAAFYHVHRWRWPDRPYSCLDRDNCIIGKRITEGGASVQPKTVVAVVKFEVNGESKYEARYSNCYPSRNHAEDFFVCDARHGALRNILNEYNVGDKQGGKSITMYLTYQPCNKSITRTQGTPPDQSCCDILRKVYTDILQPRNIGLSIKAAHTHYVLDHTPTPQQQNLKTNAETGIRDLKGSGVTVSGMAPNDWEYLFSLSSANFQQHYAQQRTDLDRSVNSILAPLVPN